MKTAKRVTRMLHVVFAALLVVACGGGGGGGSTTPTVPTAGVSITPANAELIAATIVNSVQIVEGISTLPGFLPGVAVNPAGGGFNYPDFFLKQLQWLPALANQSNTGSLTGVVVPATVVDCTDPLIGGTAGTVTVSGDVADPSLDTITDGDQFDLDFNACVLDGIELNGGMSLTVITIPPNFDGTPPFSVELAAVLSGFSANDAGFIVTGDGDMTIQLDADTIGNLITVLSGSSLLASATGAAEQLTNFLFNIADNLVTGDYSVDLSGTIATTALGGSVSYVTNLPFTGNDNVANDPTAGEMHITTTADSSQERVTALTNGVDVMIEVDADGNSSYETTIMTTWTALRTP